MKQLVPWGVDGNMPNSLVVMVSLEEGEGCFSILPSPCKSEQGLEATFCHL